MKDKRNNFFQIEFKSVEKLAKYLGCKALDIIVEEPD